MKRRLGRFEISARFFDDVVSDEGHNIFDRMIVFEAIRDFFSWKTDYVASHPDFRLVDAGEHIPLYTAIFRDGSCLPEWSEAK